MRQNHVVSGGPRLGWYLAAGVAVLAIAGCQPPMPDNTPKATGTPVVAAEVIGHWFKLIGEGEPEIDIYPALVESLVNQFASQLLEQIPELTENNPLYIHVSDLLDKGAVADVGAGVYMLIEIPEAQQIAPAEQPNGSLLFEGEDLMSFINQVLGSANTVPDDINQIPFDLGGIPINDLVVKLWLYRMAGSEDLLFRLCAEASASVPVVGQVRMRVTIDGTGYASDGPEADGLEQGSF